jgi:hypothetical protein
VKELLPSLWLLLALSLSAWTYQLCLTLFHASILMNVRAAGRTPGSSRLLRASTALTRWTIIGGSFVVHGWFGFHLGAGAFRIHRWAGVVLSLVLALLLIVTTTIALSARGRATSGFGWLADYGLSQVDTRSVARSTVYGELGLVWILTPLAVPGLAFFAAPWYPAGRDVAALTAYGALLLGASAMPLLMPAHARLFAHTHLLNATRLVHAGKVGKTAKVRTRSSWLQAVWAPYRTPAEIRWSNVGGQHVAVQRMLRPLRLLILKQASAYRGVDRSAYLRAANPVVRDVGLLTESIDDIRRSPALVRALRLAILGDNTMLSSGWSAPPGVADDRAWGGGYPRWIKAVSVGLGFVTAALAAVKAVADLTP